MPLRITANFFYSNKAIHIDAPNGVDFVDPNNPGNSHHFNPGDIIPANTRTEFNNGVYQNIPFVPVPLGGGAANVNIHILQAAAVNIMNGMNIAHNNNGDLFAFAPNSVLNGLGGIYFEINFDLLGEMHIDEVLL